MSSPGTKPAPAPVDPNAEIAQSAVRHILTAVGSLMAAHGLIGPHNAIDPDSWLFWTGLIVALVPFAWSWYQKIAAAKTAKEREAIAVSAGINLVVQGAALASDGSIIATNSVLPPKAVTTQTAQAIIQNFGPTKV